MLYGLVVGLVIGFVVIRLDLAFTGPRGRRGRRAEEAGALRPEPLAHPAAALSASAALPGTCG